MPANRITRYLPVNRIASQQAAAMCCGGFVAVPAMLMAPGSRQLDIYRQAFAAAQQQVAERQRLQMQEQLSYQWN